MNVKSIQGFEFSKYSGHVTGVQAWGSTSVYGGGVSTDAQGVVSGGAIYSSINNHTRFFVNAENKEIEVNIDNGFGVRDGHKVTVFCGKHEGDLNGKQQVVYCINHSTDQEHVFGGAIDFLVGLNDDHSAMTLTLGMLGFVIGPWFSYKFSAPGVSTFENVLISLFVGPILAYTLSDMFYGLIVDGPKKTKKNRVIAYLRGS